MVLCCYEMLAGVIVVQDTRSSCRKQGTSHRALRGLVQLTSLVTHGRCNLQSEPSRRAQGPCNSTCTALQLHNGEAQEGTSVAVPRSACKRQQWQPRVQQSSLRSLEPMFAQRPWPPVSPDSPVPICGCIASPAPRARVHCTGSARRTAPYKVQYDCTDGTDPHLG